MKRLFALILCLMLLFLPMTAMAAGELPLEDFIGPQVGIGVSLLFVVALIIVDVALGVILARKNEEFDWTVLPQFLYTGVEAYVFPLVVLAALAYLLPYVLPAAAIPLAGIFYASALATAGKYVSEFKDKLKLIFGVELE